MNPTTAGTEKASGVAANAQKEPTITRKYQRTKVQREREAEEKTSAVAENAPKDPTFPRKYQRTKEQREREAAAAKSTIAKDKDVPASPNPTDKPLSKRRQAIIHNTRQPSLSEKEVASNKTTNAEHVTRQPTTIKETQPDNRNEDRNDDSGNSSSGEDNNDTPAKAKGVLKRDLSTPSSASQDSFGETSR
jgi:hypothetical protein